MTLPLAENYRVSLNFTGGPVPTGAAVVFSVFDSLTRSPALIGADVIAAWTASGIMANLSANIDIVSVLVKQGPDETGASALVAAAIPGTKAGTTGAPNVAFLVHKSTDAGGRRGRGRMFLPGVAEADVDEAGNIWAATMNTLQGDVTQLLAELDSRSIPMYLEHAPATNWALVDGQPRRVPSGAAPAPTEVTALTVDSRAATQRRRLRR